MHSILSIFVVLLQVNEDYTSYCAAVEANDTRGQEELAAKVPKLPEVFADFGDVRDLNAFDPAQFEPWHRAHDKLFVEPYTQLVEWVPCPDGHEVRPGHMVLDIALHRDKAKTLAAVREYLETVYEVRFDAGDAFVGWEEELQEVQTPLTGAKYQLPPGFNQASLSRLKRAVFAGMAAHGLSQAETVLAIKRARPNPFGWSMSKADEESVRLGTFLKDIQGSSELTLVKRALKDFRHYVENAASGRLFEPD